MADALLGKESEMVHIGLSLHHCLVFAHCVFIPNESRRQVGVFNNTGRLAKCQNATYIDCTHKHQTTLLFCQLSLVNRAACVCQIWCDIHSDYDGIYMPVCKTRKLEWLRIRMQLILQLMQPLVFRGDFMFRGIYNCVYTQTHTSALGWAPLQTGSVCWAFWLACNGCNTACDPDPASGTHALHYRSEKQVKQVRGVTTGTFFMLLNVLYVH